MLALLYPFDWPHVFVPVLPTSMCDVLAMPMPFVIGILSSTYGELLQSQNFSFAEVSSKVLSCKKFAILAKLAFMCLLFCKSLLENSPALLFNA